MASDPVTTAQGPSAVRTTIRTLVVPFDGSEVAARVAPVVRQLAELTGADVRIVTSTVDGDGAALGQIVDFESSFDGLDVDHVIVDDRVAADAVIDVSLATDGGLICMSTHGRSGLGRAVLGSVADAVLRSGVVPLVLVGPSCDSAALHRAGPVTLCVDGSDRSEPVMESGLAWARLLDRGACLVLVSNPFDAITRAESSEMFERLEASHPTADVELSTRAVVNSSLAWGLVTEAERNMSPLMVIGPASRSKWERLLIGSTTLAILGGATCPVLVLESEGH
jgi:nucleotide-binding universal stress UspA family protein